MTKPNLPTIARLNELFSYCPDTGTLTRKVTTRYGAEAGTPAGYLSHGYLFVKVDQCKVSVHRIAWALYYGHYPENLIDHRDGDRSNNRIKNLRDVTKAANNQNQRAAHVGSATGFLGVELTRSSTFRAMIKVDGKAKYLGAYPTPEAAHDAYLRAKRVLHSSCTI